MDEHLEVILGRIYEAEKRIVNIEAFLREHKSTLGESYPEQPQTKDTSDYD